MARADAAVVYLSQNWYDVRYANLSPTPETMKLVQAASSATEWRAFAKRCRGEMATAENARTLDLLAVRSHQTHFSVGCYCADEARCHRAVLKALLIERGAGVVEARHPEGAGE